MIFDPKSVTILAVKHEPRIDLARLSSDGVRRVFTNAQLELAEALEQPQCEKISDFMASKLRPAGVLVPLVIRESGLTVLFTRRTDHLSDHAGQISFPGGGVEAQDQSIDETALRETEEEIGLTRYQIEVLGQLPNYLSVSGYKITPIVGLIQPPFTVQPDPFEVAEIFEVPLEFLMDPANHQLRKLDLQGQRRHFYSMSYGDYFVWGVTAAILRSLYRVLLAPE